MSEVGLFQPLPHARTPQGLFQAPPALTIGHYGGTHSITRVPKGKPRLWGHRRHDYSFGDETDRREQERLRVRHRMFSPTANAAAAMRVIAEKYKQVSGPWMAHTPGPVFVSSWRDEEDWDWPEPWRGPPMEPREEAAQIAHNALTMTPERRAARWVTRHVVALIESNPVAPGDGLPIFRGERGPQGA